MTTSEHASTGNTGARIGVASAVAALKGCGATLRIRLLTSHERASSDAVEQHLRAPEHGYPVADAKAVAGLRWQEEPPWIPYGLRAPQWWGWMLALYMIGAAWWVPSEACSRELTV